MQITNKNSKDARNIEMIELENLILPDLFSTAIRNITILFPVEFPGGLLPI